MTQYVTAWNRREPSQASRMYSTGSETVKAGLPYHWSIVVIIIINVNYVALVLLRRLSSTSVLI